MVRRLAGVLILLVVLGSVGTGSPSRHPGPTVPETALGPIVPLADVSWPPSSGLLLAEVVTGGASASDEYVELTNAGPLPVDLGGYELVYVTSSGGTVTRKAAWAGSLFLEPGRHLLLANGLGAFAAIADATYSGGLSAAGGALVLRPVGGAPVDAVGWGDATNGFVEGAAAPAPPPGASIERRPGGSAGNREDTNDNAADWFVQSAPLPQNLAAPPAPLPSPSAPPPSPSAPPPSEEPAPWVSPTPSPVPTSTPLPTQEPPSPAPTATSSPSMTPAPSLSVSPSASPAPPPSPPEPSPSGSPTPSPPEPSPTPSLTIAAIRGLPLGTVVAATGVLTTDLGALESGRSAFLQDETAGIGLYLAAPVATPMPAGTRVSLRGTLDSRYGQLVLRVAEPDVTALGEATLPLPIRTATGAAGETLEGTRVTVRGAITESPSALADGLGVTIDDGSGPLRIVVGAAALGDVQLVRGDEIEATGPLGQRDSSGTGLAGYRVYTTLAGELVILPSSTPRPSPTPLPTPPEPTSSPSPGTSPSPSPSSIPGPSPVPSPSPTSGPSPGPSATPNVLSIAEARSRSVGTVVRVGGVVTAEPGRLGHPALVVVADSTGAIVVRLDDGDPRPGRGDLLTVEGSLGDPYGQLEVRATREVVPGGSGPLPEPLPVLGIDLGEATEARLVRLAGVLKGTVRRATSGDIAFDLVDDAGMTVRIMADGSSGLTAGSFRSGARYELTGIVGQRASRKGALDGYRIWLRDRADVLELASAEPSTTPGPTPAPGGGSSPGALLPIRSALRASGVVTIEGTVTAPATLLDASGRRIVVQDGTGAVEILLPASAAAPSLGEGIRATGTMGRAYGAPRLRASEIERLGVGRPVVAARLDRAPGPADEWRLVRVSGTVVGVRRLGGRWRAELAVRGERVAVDGLAGAGIPASILVEGRPATVTGIVRRPYPTAADRRFAVLPRGSADVAVGPSLGAASGSTGAIAQSPGSSTGGSLPPPVSDVDLADLARHVGSRVRVGGLVVTLIVDGFRLDDGTAEGRVVLGGEAAGYLDLIEPGDAVNVVGFVRRVGTEVAVVVEEAAGLIPVGDLGASTAFDEPGALPFGAASPEVGPEAPNAAGLGGSTAPVPILPLGLVLGGSIASILGRVLLRERARLRLAARVRARLAAIQRSGRR